MAILDTGRRINKHLLESALGTICVHPLCFMLSHGKTVFLVSFSMIALKALRHKASRLVD